MMISGTKRVRLKFVTMQPNLSVPRNKLRDAYSPCMTFIALIFSRAACCGVTA